jgi:uncharacterized coiled-coil DUF342 family protein
MELRREEAAKAMKTLAQEYPEKVAEILTETGKFYKQLGKVIF